MKINVPISSRNEKHWLTRLPNVFVLINLALVSYYLFNPDAARVIFEWVSSYGLANLPCHSSWGNASLSYRTVLYLSAPQSMMFMVGAAMFEILLYEARSTSGVLEKLRPASVIIFGVGLGLIWFCLLGSDVPITQPNKLGTYHDWMFNTALGVLVVTVFGSSLGIELGRAIGSLLRNKRRSFKDTIGVNNDDE